MWCGHHVAASRPSIQNFWYGMLSSVGEMLLVTVVKKFQGHLGPHIMMYYIVRRYCTGKVQGGLWSWYVR